MLRGVLRSYHIPQFSSITVRSCVGDIPSLFRLLVAETAASGSSKDVRFRFYW